MASKEFSIYTKSQIYYKQNNRNFNNLEKLSIPLLNNHLSIVKNINNYCGLIVCPYCINCYIHPGTNVVNDLKKRYGLIIYNDKSIFDSSDIRPGECSLIDITGKNFVDNGIYICYQCYRQKGNMTLQHFFLNNFISDGVRYYRRSEMIRTVIEMMDKDNFDNKCFSCGVNSEYKICQNCAGRKGEIIKIA